MSDQCKRCQAKIMWIVTENGKKMPLDAVPEKRYVFMHSNSWKLQNTYMPHWATCPYASEFKKK